ncbi:MAG: DedA family protein, partial [Chloroflexi bacterium]|nr:DedA family protein [Chloroflexota bacterium]
MTERLLQLIEEHEYLSIFSILFIEEAGIPLPLPGDTVMLFAGYLVHAGKMNAFLSLLSLETGTMAGASTLYWVARFGGRPFVLRYGRWFGLSRERIA